MSGDKEIKVVKWVSDEEVSDDQAIGWLGGHINGEKWDKYIRDFQPEVRPYLSAVFQEIKKHRLRFGGDYHQYGEMGVPLFNDGKALCLSFRAWGDLMAAAWNSIENTTKYSYMDFYVNCLVDGIKTPEEIEEAENGKTN